MSTVDVMTDPGEIGEALLVGATAGVTATYMINGLSISNMVTIFVLYFIVFFSLKALQWALRKAESKFNEDERLRYDWTPHRAS